MLKKSTNCTVKSNFKAFEYLFLTISIVQLVHDVKPKNKGEYLQNLLVFLIKNQLMLMEQLVYSLVKNG